MFINILIKGSIHQEDITVINIYASVVRSYKNDRIEGRNRLLQK